MNYNEINLVDKVRIAFNDFGTRVESFYKTYETHFTIDPPCDSLSGNYTERIKCNHCSKQFDLRIEYRVMALIPPEIIAKLLNDKTGKTIVRNLILDAFDLRTSLWAGVIGFLVCILFSIFLVPMTFQLPLSRETIIDLILFTIPTLIIFFDYLKFKRNKKHLKEGFALININNQKKYDYLQSYNLDKRSFITSVSLVRLEEDTGNYVMIGSSEHYLQDSQPDLTIDCRKEQIRLKSIPWSI